MRSSSRSSLSEEFLPTVFWLLPPNKQSEPNRTEQNMHYLGLKGTPVKVSLLGQGASMVDAWSALLTMTKTHHLLYATW